MRYSVQFLDTNAKTVHRQGLMLAQENPACVKFGKFEQFLAKICQNLANFWLKFAKIFSKKLQNFCTT
jgi:hypothetical protein